MFDADGSGYLTTSEMAHAMTTLSKKPTEAELEDIINIVDGDGNGEIDFPEFLILMAKRLNEEELRSELKLAFEAFSKKADYISVENLK
jgi:Ca2+-binding EF-hand superfamily protein